MNKRIANKLKKMAGVRDVTIQEAFDIVAKNLLQRDKNGAAIFFMDVIKNYKTDAKALNVYTALDFDNILLESREFSLAEQCERSFEIDWTEGIVNDLPWQYVETEEDEEIDEIMCTLCGNDTADPDTLDDICPTCYDKREEEDEAAKKHEEAEYRDMKI